MLGPTERLLRFGNGRWNGAFLPIGLRTDQREVKFSNVNPLHIVSRRCALGIGVGSRMNEMVAVAIGMTINDEDASHASI